MSSEFRLLMLSAMYENGGNTTHRFLDGHPQLYVYPFESQTGTRLVNDHLSAMYPVKYRWPVFSLESTAREDYKAIIDEECKVRALTPKVSKFRHVEFDFSDDDRMQRYVEHVSKTGRSRANNISAFFKATFEAWKNYKRSGEERVYVGYSPIIGVDSDKILNDLPTSHILHVVRNPWSAFADTKKRPVPLSLNHYMLGWTLNQYHALMFKEKFPDRMHIVRLEDLLSDPKLALGRVLEKMGLESSETLNTSTWNGEPLKEIFPWGTIRKATPEANMATANELSREEKEAIAAYAFQYLDVFDYKAILSSNLLTRA